MPNAAQRLDAPMNEQAAQTKSFIVKQTQQVEHLEMELVQYDALGFEPVEIIPLGPRSHQIVFRRKELNPAIRIALEIRKLRDAVAAASGKPSVDDMMEKITEIAANKDKEKAKAQSKPK